MLFNHLIYLYLNILLSPSTTDTLKECIGSSACEDTQYICPSNEQCSIQCSGNSACYGLNITCPSNATCIVNCVFGQTDTCRNILIDASNSTSLKLDCQQCAGAHVYCPTNGPHREPACKISGILGRSLQLYAIEGWTDLDITGVTDVMSEVNINCGSSYEGGSCLLNTLEPFECEECQNYESSDPTTKPKIPSYQESTNSSTITFMEQITVQINQEIIIVFGAIIVFLLIVILLLLIFICYRRREYRVNYDELTRSEGNIGIAVQENGVHQIYDTMPHI